MRILHVITTIARGGAEHHLLALTRGQRAAGHLPAVAYLKEKPELQSDFESAGVPVYALGRGARLWPGSVYRLRRLLGQVQPDLVHAHMPPAEVVLRAALIGAKALPLVVSRHNREPFWPAWPWAGIRIARWVSARARATIAISAAVARHVQEEGSLPSGRIHVIHYGVDRESFRAATIEHSRKVRLGWGIPEAAIVFGTIARLVPQKAIPTLLEAFSTVHKEAGDTPVKLVIVGRGELEQPLRARAAALGLEGDCIWAGFRTDIPAVLGAFNVFVLTSAWEGLGLVLLEAMAAGRPIVATRVDAIPEIVAEGEAGLLCSVGDVAEIAAAMMSLLDPVRREHLGAAGLRRVDGFSIEQMVTKTLGVYAEALG